MLFMRSVRVRRCRAKHDVLFIPQLVTHLFVAFLCCFLFLFLFLFFFFWLLLLLLLLLLLFVGCCCCFRCCRCGCCGCCCVVVFVFATHLIVYVGSTNRHIGGVCAFFDTLGANNIVNTVVFAPRKPKTTVFTMFFCFW